MSLVPDINPWRYPVGSLEEALDRFVRHLRDTIINKNIEYADVDDPLANFRETSQFLNCSMFEALLPHMYKHFRAIVKGYNTYTYDDLHDRLIDLAAYTIFIDMIKESEIERP
jgi:hypothetical protein